MYLDEPLPLARVFGMSPFFVVFTRLKKVPGYAVLKEEELHHGGGAGIHLQQIQVGACLCNKSEMVDNCSSHQRKQNLQIITLIPRAY